MAGFWGLDVQQMQRFQTMLTDSAEEIRSIVGELDALTASVDWRGDDATQFKTSTWKGIYDQLAKVTSALNASAAAQKTADRKTADRKTADRKTQHQHHPDQTK